MSHNHGHHEIPSHNRAFALATLLNSLFIVIEVIYAISANSMSLLADAVHNFGDILGLIFAWVASWLLTKAANERYSYGYKRTSIIAALSNALLLIATSALIAYESIQKFLNPEIVHEQTVILVALIGIVINGGTALLFMRGRHDDLNIRGAFMHLAYDALISLGVVVTGFLMMYTGNYWLDPGMGLLIVFIIIWGTWDLLRDSMNLMLDAVPHDVDQKAVLHYLQEIKGVQSVHDVHIWGLSTRDYALTAHLVMPENGLSDSDHSDINNVLHQRFNINHVTLQVEQGSVDDPCGQSC